MKQNQYNKNKPIRIFAVTLGLILALGTGAILLAAYARGNVTNHGVKTETMTDTGLLWEKIPEHNKESIRVDNEILEENGRYKDILNDEEYLYENRIYPRSAAEEGCISLCFTGDILLDDEYAIMAKLQNRGGQIEDGISTELLERMRSADVLVVNNEFPYTDRGTPTEGKTFTFRADTDAVSYLADMGADVAILANNHTYDFGEQGLLDTLDTLDGAGICRIGAGRNLEEASSPVSFIINDQKISLIAATQIERLDSPDTKGATPESAGVFRCWNPDELCKVIKETKDSSDYVIVCVHWGTENESEPDWAQIEQAKKIAEAGADLIIGDHPHCLQGITYIGETPVVYSLGNFWFNSKTVDTGILCVTLDENGLQKIQFVPALQEDCRVTMAYGIDKERILSHLRTLSPEIQMDEEGFIKKS